MKLIFKTRVGQGKGTGNIYGLIRHFPGYRVETEKNSACSRVSIYVSNKLDFVRRADLEGTDSNILIIDLVGTNKTRIIIQSSITQYIKFFMLALLRRAPFNLPKMVWLYLAPKRDLHLGLSRIAVFEDCKATALTTQPPLLNVFKCLTSFWVLLILGKFIFYVFYLSTVHKQLYNLSWF